MAPTSDLLRGLNVVHQPPPPSTLTDSQDLLVQPYPNDLAAQLDLWTNVSFASDEPYIQHERDGSEQEYSPESPLEDQPEKASVDHLHGGSESADFDINNFLMNLSSSSDPFLVPPSFFDNDGHHGNHTDPSESHDGFPQLNPLVIDPALRNEDASNKRQPSVSVPAVKRARTKKSASSTTTTTSPTLKSSMPEEIDTRGSSSVTSALDHDEYDDGEPNTSTPLTPSEDKRRRNTAASARFRLKKKEREQAMDKKARDLENKVLELERECEALKRENGWLKGLVVGVTGGNPGSVPSVHPSSLSISGVKRTRDESDKALMGAL